MEELKEMTEPQLNTALSKSSVNMQSKREYNVNVPKEEEVLTKTIALKSNVHILPLWLEDNSTIFGTMGILNDFSEQFGLPNDTKQAEYLPFDCVTRNLTLFLLDHISN